MVRISESSMMATVGLVVFAMVALAAVGGVVFFPIIGVLALSIPIVFYLAETDSESNSEPAMDAARTDEEDAVELLRRQFATGRIDETEFERRLEVLLETEAVADRNADRELLRE